MKILTISILLGLITLTGVAQRRVYNSDELSVERHSEEEYGVHKRLSDGKPLKGICRLNEGGDSYMICNFKKGILHGEFKYYNGDKLLRIGLFENGTLQGRVRELYEDGETTKIEVDYVDGQITGWARAYYPSGKLELESECRMGAREGVERSSDEQTGILIAECTYTDGALNGTYRIFDGQTGVIREEFTYANGELDGDHRTFDEQGLLLEEVAIKPIKTKDQLPPYRPLVARRDYLTTFESAEAQISLTYPTNWQTGESDADFPELIRQQIWANASNSLTLTVCRYDTDGEYQQHKQLSLSIPRDFNGDPSPDYNRSTLTINGHDFIKTENLQRIGHPKEEGYELLQSVLYYFVPQERLIYCFVMLINEKEAQLDLNAMMESVKFGVAQ